MQGRLAQLKIPDVVLSDPFPSFALDETMSLDELVKLRKQHQTRVAAEGVRTRTSKTSAPKDANSALKKQIRRKMFEVLKNHEVGQGVETGNGRALRWRSAAKGGREGLVEGETAPEPAAGTAANAAQVAGSAAKKVDHSPHCVSNRQLMGFFS